MNQTIAAVVTEAAIGPIAAALARIEEIGERLYQSPSMRPWGMELQDIAQDIKDSITLIEDTPNKEDEGK